MAAITREEEREIKEWQARGGRCIDRVETIEERIARNEAEIAANLRALRAQCYACYGKNDLTCTKPRGHGGKHGKTK